MYERDGQVVGVVLSMQGTQEIDVAAHHLGGPHAAIGVRIGGTLMYLHERRTAEQLDHLWTRHRADAALLPARLPAWFVRKSRRGREVSGLVGATVVMDARGAPPLSTRLVRAEGRPTHLRVQVGRVVFNICDQAAFTSVHSAFHDAAVLAASVMPGETRPRSRRERAFEQASAALPPVTERQPDTGVRPPAAVPAKPRAREPVLGQEQTG